jgi:hypothetical protein
MKWSVVWILNVDPSEPVPCSEGEGAIHRLAVLVEPAR